MNDSGLERGSMKVKTESGKKISSAYKTNMYACHNFSTFVCFS